MTERRYTYPSMVVGAALGLVLALLLMVIPGSRSQAITAEELTAGLTPGIPAIAMPSGQGLGYWNIVDVATGVVLDSWGGSEDILREGRPQWPRWTSGDYGVSEKSFIWTPLYGYRGQYYTNGLLVAGGFYVTPGTTTVINLSSGRAYPAAPLSPPPPTATGPEHGGVTGVEVRLVPGGAGGHSPGCYPTADGYRWTHHRCDGAQVFFVVCLRSDPVLRSINNQNTSWGYRLLTDGQTIAEDSRQLGQAMGMVGFAWPSCTHGGNAGGFWTSNPGPSLQYSTSYVIEAWGRHAGHEWSTTFTFTTHEAPFDPPISPEPESPTVSATTTVAPSTTTVPTVSATSTTTTVADTSTTAPPAPPAGEATVDGQATAVTLSATDTAVTARSGDVTVEVTPAITPDDIVASTAVPSTFTADTTTIEVAPLQAVEVATSGFQPGSEVEIWLHSTPMLLARAKADSTGALRTAVQIPAQVPAGDHRLVITGRSTDGETLSIAMAVRVQSATPTGDSSSSTAVIWITVLAFIAGGAVLIARRRFTLRSSGAAMAGSQNVQPMSRRHETSALDRLIE